MSRWLNNSFTLDFTQRNKSIDIIRALTMLLMVFVNDFWTVKAVPHCLVHGGTMEDFMGLADFVFPCFLFVVGLSIPYAIENRYSKGCSELSTVFHIFSRTLALWIMGVFLVNTESGISREVGMNLQVYKLLMTAGFFMIWNVYPNVEEKWKQNTFLVIRILGVVLLSYLAVIFKDGNGHLFRTSWWGILGSIGWTYLIGAFCYLAFRTNVRKHFIVCIIFAILSMVEASHLIPKEFFLQQFLQMFYLTPGTKNFYCSAGILVSLLSLRTEGWKPSRRFLLAVCSVAFLVGAAFISHNFWIWSKNLATPPTMFLCTGASIALYCIIRFLVSKGKDGCFRIIRAAGTATLTCYMVPTIVNAVLRLLHLGPEMNLSGAFGLSKCLLFAFVCVWITALLEKINVKLKI